MGLLRKQPVAAYSPWNFDLEAGDRVYERVYGGYFEGEEIYAQMIDLRESNGRNKASAGELTPRVVKKNGKPRIAVLCEDGLWRWRD